MSILILGATSPIAREIGGCYARMGRSVFLAGRDLDEVERIASDLRLRYRSETHSGEFDARDFEGHEAFLDEVEATAGPIEVVVLAFGDMGTQEDSERDFSHARRVIEVNYSGAVSVCEQVARRMVERGDGSIIGVSSVAGERGRKSNYIYGSAKGAFTLYLGGLRNRLFDSGVHVMTVKLGFVDTRMTFGMSTPIPIADPDDAARAIVDGQLQRKDILYYPRFWSGVMGVIRAIPEGVFKRLSI